MAPSGLGEHPIRSRPHTGSSARRIPVWLCRIRVWKLIGNLPSNGRRRFATIIWLTVLFDGRRFFATARTYNSRGDVIFGRRSGVGKRTVGTIELILDIFAICTNPRFVKASNSQPSAIGKSDGFSSVVDKEGHRLFNLDRALVPSPIRHDDFSNCAIELSARLLRLAHLHRVG